MFFIGNRCKKKHLLISETYCRIAIVLFIYVNYTNKICLYQEINGYAWRQMNIVYQFLFLFCFSHFWNSHSPFSSPLMKLAPSINSACPHFLDHSWSFATIPLSSPLRLFIPLTFQFTYNACPLHFLVHLQSFPSHLKVTSKTLPNPFTFRSIPTPLSNEQCFSLACDENESWNRSKGGLDPYHKKIRCNGCDVKMQLSNS